MEYIKLIVVIAGKNLYRNITIGIVNFVQGNVRGKYQDLKKDVFLGIRDYQDTERVIR